MTRSFSDFTVFQEFVFSDKSKLLQYLELMYSRHSPLHGMEKHEERRALALKKIGINVEETVELKELAWHYLSYYENDAKFQNLLMYRSVFYDLHHIAMEEIGDADSEERTKAVKLRREIVTACEDLEAKISGLMAIIYPESLKWTADLKLAEINKVTSHEQRLKEKKKKTTVPA